MAFQFGDLVLARYQYFHNDQMPFVFVLYDDTKLIDGLNSHYLSKVEVEQLRRLLKSVQPGQEKFVYPFLKARFNSVLRAYRRYRDIGFFPIKQWKVKELTSPRTRQEQDKEMAHSVDYTKTPSVSEMQKALLRQMKDALARLNQKKK